MIKSTFCHERRLFSNYTAFPIFRDTAKQLLTKKLVFDPSLAFLAFFSFSGKLRSYVFKEKLLLLSLSFLVGNSVVFSFDYILFYVKVYFQNILETDFDIKKYVQIQLP